MPPKFEKEDLDRGFVVTGLWSLSRHPNFAAEQTIWVLVYLWSCYAADAMFSWAGVGAAFYCALFQVRCILDGDWGGEKANKWEQASTNLTESITAGKYPEYKEYQMRVNRFIPGLATLKGGDEMRVKKDL